MKHDICKRVESEKYKYYSQRWGYEKEKIIKFIYDLDDVYIDRTYPCKVLNIGITFPNPNYKIVRANCRIFVIEYILSGKGYLIINGKKFTLEAGDTYILEKGTSHTYYSDKKDPFKKIWVNFYSYSYGDVLKSLDLNGIYHFPKVNLEDYFNKIFMLEKVSPNINDIAFKAYNIILQMTLHIKENLLNNSRNNIPSIVNKIKQIIDDNNKITIEELCKNLNISRPTIINLFKKYYGLTPNQYRIKNLMNSACMYLINSDKSILEISSILGYTDAYTFSHAFKKSIGVSPTHYRNSNSNPPIDY